MQYDAFAWSKGVEVSTVLDDEHSTHPRNEEDAKAKWYAAGVAATGASTSVVFSSAIR